MKSGCNEDHLRTNTLVQFSLEITRSFLFFYLEQLSQGKKTKGSRSFCFEELTFQI